MAYADATKLTVAELIRALAYESDLDNPSTGLEGKPYVIHGPTGLLAVAAARLDQLQNEVNAVEWVNGRIEKELFECRRRT